MSRHWKDCTTEKSNLLTLQQLVLLSESKIYCCCKWKFFILSHQKKKKTRHFGRYQTRRFMECVSEPTESETYSCLFLFWFEGPTDAAFTWLEKYHRTMTTVWEILEKNKHEVAPKCWILFLETYKFSVFVSKGSTPKFHRNSSKSRKHHRHDRP